MAKIRPYLSEPSPPKYPLTVSAIAPKIPADRKALFKTANQYHDTAPQNPRHGLPRRQTHRWPRYYHDDKRIAEGDGGDGGERWGDYFNVRPESTEPRQLFASEVLFWGGYLNETPNADLKLGVNQYIFYRPCAKISAQNRLNLLFNKSPTLAVTVILDRDGGAIILTCAQNRQNPASYSPARFYFGKDAHVEYLKLTLNLV